MNLYLCKMTNELAHQYFQRFEHDPNMFLDNQPFREYKYDKDAVDAYCMRQGNLGREHLAIINIEEPIGEVVLKNIDAENKSCTLGIHLKNDSVKNRGYGTKAEILALKYAFETLGLKTVFADAIHKNRRSQHVLEKVGFLEIGSDAEYIYYRCDAGSWNFPINYITPDA